jgi:hypothetical protein
MRVQCPILWEMRRGFEADKGKAVAILLNALPCRYVEESRHGKHKRN